MMTVDEREERAGARVAEERVRPIALEDGSYLVASSSVAGRGYRVYVDPDGTAISCTCPAGNWQWPCKHAAAVRQLRSTQQVRLPRAS
jgi:uncharacterized Zn finger protein